MAISARTRRAASAAKTARVVGVPDDRARLLQVFSELERVALHREVEIADGNPVTMSRMAPPVRYRFISAAFAASDTRAIALLLIRREPGSSVYM